MASQRVNLSFLANKQAGETKVLLLPACLLACLLAVL